MKPTPNSLDGLRELAEQIEFEVDNYGPGGKTTERIMQLVEAAYADRSRDAVRKAFQKHHEQYPDCPPRLLAKSREEEK